MVSRSMIITLEKGGFKMVYDKDGKWHIVHPQYGVFESWLECVLTCIEVATEQ